MVGCYEAGWAGFSSRRCRGGGCGLGKSDLRVQVRYQGMDIGWAGVKEVLLVDKTEGVASSSGDEVEPAEFSRELSLLPHIVRSGPQVVFARSVARAAPYLSRAAVSGWGTWGRLGGWGTTTRRVSAGWALRHALSPPTSRCPLPPASSHLSLSSLPSAPILSFSLLSHPLLVLSPLCSSSQSLPSLSHTLSIFSPLCSPLHSLSSLILFSFSLPSAPLLNLSPLPYSPNPLSSLFSSTFLASPHFILSLAPLAACAAAWGVAFVDPSDPTDCGIALNITCDAAGMVDWMVLNSGGIAGPIPPSIGALIGLTHLDLDNNALTGSIPPTISRLTRLLYLDLSYNQLSGSIPTAIDGLLSITELNFRNNRLTGSIPAVIGNLTTLNDLYLSSNQLNGSLPAQIGNLHHLSTLDVISGNQLSGVVPPVLGGIPLGTLSIYDSNVTCPTGGSCQLKQDPMSAFCLECPDFCASCTPSPGSPPPPARSPLPAPAFPPPRVPRSPPAAAFPPLISQPSPPPPSLSPPPPRITLSPPVPTTSPPPELSLSPPALPSQPSPSTNPSLTPPPFPPPLPSSPSVPPTNSSSSGGGVSVAVVAGVAAAAVCVVVVLLVLGFCWWRSKKKKQHVPSGASHASSQPFLDPHATAGALSVCIGVCSSPPVPLPPVQVDQMATKHHPNLVRLLGFCNDVDAASQLLQQILVYEFMGQGDLAKRMRTGESEGARERGATAWLWGHSGRSRSSCTSSWGRATSLRGCGQAKVSDFGLLRLGEGRPTTTTSAGNTSSGSGGGGGWGSTRVMGTPGYVDPVYYKTHKATPSLDVYSFGVVMLEVVLGRGPVVLLGTECINIKDWAAPLLAADDLTPLLDPSLQAQPPGTLPSSTHSREQQLRLTRALTELGLACTHVPTASRPSMASLISSLSSLKREFFGTLEGTRDSSGGRKGYGNAGAAGDAAGGAGAGGGAGGGGVVGRVIHEEDEENGALELSDGIGARAGGVGAGAGTGELAGAAGEAPGKQKGDGGGMVSDVGLQESAEEVDRAFMEGLKEQGRTLDEELFILNHMLVMSAVQHSGMHLSSSSALPSHEHSGRSGF
ncbi:unnamed protein product [Closterium sp. Naga37s-1]|nr:unnamed protein product [Closterium sp. Naga37s-1]